MLMIYKIQPHDLSPSTQSTYQNKNIVV